MSHHRNPEFLEVFEWVLEGPSVKGRGCPIGTFRHEGLCDRGDLAHFLTMPWVVCYPHNAIAGNERVFVTDLELFVAWMVTRGIVTESGATWLLTRQALEMSSDTCNND